MKKRTCSRVKKAIRCPCCREISTRWDVWYDCQCFNGPPGGKPGCATCALPETVENRALSGPRVDAIAATLREWGCDKHPSPGMLDYLTPGWRPIEPWTPPPPKPEGAEDDEIPF